MLDNLPPSIVYIIYLSLAFWINHVIMCSMNICKPKPIKVMIRTKKIQQINIEAFRHDILLSELYSFSSNNVKNRLTSLSIRFSLSLTSTPLKLSALSQVDLNLHGIVMISVSSSGNSER